MSAEVAVEDSKSSALALYPSASLEVQQHHMKASPESPPPQPSIESHGNGNGLGSSNDSGHEDQHHDDHGDEVPMEEHDDDEDRGAGTAESSYYDRPVQHLQSDAADDAADQHGDEADSLQQPQQQYSSLINPEQSSMALPHHHQQMQLPSIPAAAAGCGDSGLIKSEAASNSSDREEAAGGAGDFYEHSGFGGPSDYSDLLPGNTSRDSLSTVVRTRRRKAGLPEDERVCAVCGDPASGYNFDRLTCESCKAFFRRNALKAREKIKPCSRGGGCDVSGSQRKHCPTCRLEKCVRVGMKKELILPPEKLEQRAKPKKRAKNGGPPSDGPSAAHHGLSPAPAAPPQPKRSAKAASSSHHHPQPSSGHHQLHHQQSQTPHAPHQHHQLQQQLQQHQPHQHFQQPQLHHGLNGQLSSSVDLDPPLFGSQHQQLHQLSRQRCPSPSRSSPSLLDAQQPPESELALVWSAGTAAGRRWPRELTATDRECLASLAEALARARETLGSSSASADSASGASAGHRKDGVGRLEQAFNQMDACIRRIISVVKLIPIFSDVEKDSQILMLKVNIYGLVILYSSFFNNSTTPAGVSSSGGAGLSLMQELAASVSAIIEMRPDVSDLTPADLDQYRANTDNVYAQLERHSRRDDIVKMLMLALKLFNSDTMPAEVRGAIDEAQSVYSQLLKKYLACKFGVAEAMRMYPRLLMTFIDMRTVENKMTEFTKLLSVESLNPLVREVTQVN
ncbi:hypothetical protein BOX15_Mlig002682g1 [Macrostomum lignano]|uniref:Nuclear receptor domain-containing protein n=1 Tax=Macrostomum lignano TaxID=282301 RepID=A0A267F6Z4_9PLAT|nr:hypothetical protein BOX15_Mlig002682g1 [Macrostomum lignano]